MNWTFELVKHAGFIHVRTSGLFHAGDFHQMLVDLVALESRQPHTRILLDNTDLNIGDVSIADFVNTVQAYSHQDHEIGFTKVAVLIKPGIGYALAVRFEAVVKKISRSVLRVFDNYDEAIDWITVKQPIPLNLVRNNLNYSEKPYRLTFRYEPKYLHVIVEGFEDSFEISNAYWSEIALECKRGKFKRVLVEERIAGNMGLTEAFEIASCNAKRDFGGATFAFVDTHPDHFDTNEFCQRVSNNRGRNIRNHATIDSAVKWLLSASK